MVTHLENAGTIIGGKTNLDEYGMGSHSIHSQQGRVSNAHGEDLSAGGSSGGSAVAVAEGDCFAALGTDTGGSVRLPAAWNGVVGFKPSYGMVSRWGVVAYANSLDTVGILGRKVRDVEGVFKVIGQGSQEGGRDPTLLGQETLGRVKRTVEEYQKQRETRPIRFGVPNEYNTSELQQVVRDAWIKTLQKLQNAGHEIVEVSLPATKAALSAYYVLAPAEASSNLAKFDGARYGNRIDEPRKKGDVLYSATRGRGLGAEVRRRILLGAYSLSAGAIDNYFIQAQKVRRLVQRDFDDIFVMKNPLVDSRERQSQESKVDFIIAPTAQSLPPKLSELDHDPIDEYSTDVLTVPASLAGLPAASVPVPVPEEHVRHSEPVNTVGMQVIGQVGMDDQILTAARLVEEVCISP